MTRHLIGVLWIAVATTNCPEELNQVLQPPAVEAVESSAAPPAGLQPYSVDGELSEAEIKTLLYLQFPQSYEDISDRFGFPAYRDSTSDYYELPNGRWVAIQYAGKTATGLKFSDSGD
ncbi:MAG: hypothetical protein F6K31_17190 [Symploca sp. SIO2G7]|nr:hypothetical protein [Symploca sp. SIO2G7]